MITLPTLPELLKAGVHFGHQRSRWHPKMKPYIFGLRSGVHIIDLETTLTELQQALAFVEVTTAEGKLVLLVGTKRQARDIIKAAAERAGMPYIAERWIGGLLTNFDEFKRRLKKYLALDQEVTSGAIAKYPKKEQLEFQKKLQKMDRYLKGLRALDRLPGAIYLCDLRVEKTAVTEARKVGVPIVAVTDTNVNPTKADYPIPGNDDAVQAITMMANLVADAAASGRARWEQAVVEAKVELAKAEPGDIKPAPARPLQKEESI